MALKSERAATPTKVTFGLAAATLLTPGASALQNGHHGVQNHSTAGLPCNDAPLKGAPLSDVPVNSRRSSAASAAGGPLSERAIAATATTMASELLECSRRVIMTAPPSARF